MKKYFMIFGLALATGVGVFALTDSFAETDLLANIMPQMGCGCEKCGADCNCSGDKVCGDADCGCGKDIAAACKGNCGGDCSATGDCGSADCGCAKKVAQTCSSGDCSGGSSCAAATGGACSAGTSSSTEVKTVGCGCGKHVRG